MRWTSSGFIRASMELCCEVGLRQALSGSCFASFNLHIPQQDQALRDAETLFEAC